MQLDERSGNLFDELLKNPSVTSKELEEKYNLTRRQFGYSFKKINDFLVSKNLPEIERGRQGNFIIEQTIITNLSDENEVQVKDTNIYSERQRSFMILLMLIGSKEELSLNHFAIELDVSRNTILNDLKHVRKIAAESDLSIKYSRINGYVIEGEEFSIRKLLFNVIDNMLQITGGDERIKYLVDIEDAELEEVRSRIGRVEKQLNLKFTDEKVALMPYDLLLVLRRIGEGKTIKSFHIEYREISHTKEYQAAEELLYDSDIPENERLFITLHLLSTNVYWAEILTEESIPNLERVLDEMLHLFEMTACITLQERDELLHKLLLHVTPAYYRIKYHLTEAADVEYLIMEDYRELFHLVKQSTKPLERLIGTKIPENEAAYLTMLIGGWMRKQGESLEEKVKAIVVCPKGVSVSRLMFSELKELFPEFVFLDSLSVREFYEYTLDFDIIFSPVFLETEKQLFLASSYLKKEEKTRLRRQVMMEVHGYVPHEISIEDMLEIIKKHAVVDNEKQLTKELYRYINPDDDSSNVQHQERPSMNLSELITLDNITIMKSVDSFEDAIRQSAVPIVESAHIEPRYVEAMVAEHTKNESYIIMGEGVVIPHAAPDDGVNDVTMSLLKIDEGVHFADEIIHLVVVIAAVDKQQHLKALLQLKDLAQSTSARESVFNANSEEEIHALLQKYSID